MSRIVAVSPHLDDAVFSVGATLARHAAQGDEVVLLTVFTASVPDPEGFALACQTDKGLAPDVDYLALRREEDRAAAAVLGLAGVVHGALPEAPHRGYASSEALFAGVREDDTARQDVRAVLEVALGSLEPDLVLAPLAIGGHVDHVVVDGALDDLGAAGRIRWIDMPYAIRDPAAVDRALEDDRFQRVAVPADGFLDAKLDACAAYASQLGFQFGDEAGMRAALSDAAGHHGRIAGAPGPAELLLGPAA